MRNVMKIGLIVYIFLSMGIIFVLLEEPKNSNKEDPLLKTKNEIEPIVNDTGYTDTGYTDCSDHGFCVGDRVELNDNATRSGMYPINGTIMKITGGKILTIQSGSAETGDENWTILSEVWVQHIKPEDTNESNESNITKVQEVEITDEGE